MKKGAVFVLIALLLVVPVQANFFTNLWESITGDIEDELDRSRIGRELNRIVEDLSEVADIMDEVGTLAQLAASNTPQGAIIVLAVRYGHDPDRLWGRFHQRVDSLEANNPGGGGGENGALSETELAAALLSVLEEPPLPEGIQMGDGCLVDLTGCPEENTESRGDYYASSCYVEGSVNKKKMAGLNRATCSVDWLDPIRGDTVRVAFPSDTQPATYAWERCARVIMQPQEQQQFVDNRAQVCNQPIAKYEVGDVCVVDYTSCSYGMTGGYNGNRVGTIRYGLLANVREYSCRVTYGDYPVKESLRESCATVYVGQDEVTDFLAAHPEPRIVVPVDPITPPVPQAELAAELGDVPNFAEEVTFRPIYGRTGVLSQLPQPLDERKEIVGAQLQSLGVSTSFSIGDLSERAVGYEVPSPLSGLFSDERAEIRVHQNYGDDVLACLTIAESRIVSLATCTDAFEPTILVETSQSIIDQIDEASDVATLLDEDRIT
ncbi:MAG: hypothetical protein AABY01_01720, partial [Nanoarchaeota archaeon]